MTDHDTRDRKDPPERAAGFVRKIDREKGYQRAAEFMLLLDRDKAASILSRLSPEEVEGIAREIVALKRIDGREAKKVLAEFGLPEPAAGAAGAEPAEIVGGFETASAMLAAALGEDRSREILSRVEKKLAVGVFDFLKDSGEEQLDSLLAGESPQTLALVVAHLDSAAASRLLKKLPPDVQKEVVRRVARMDKLLPEVVRRTADALKKKLFSQGDFSTLRIDGKSALRDILRHMEYGQEQTIIDRLSDDKPELARELEESLFTVDILRRLSYRDLQGFLRELVDRDIALLCRGEPADLKEFIMSGVSNRRRLLIEEENKRLGEGVAAAADQAKRAVLGVLKQKIGTGAVVLIDQRGSTIV